MKYLLIHGIGTEGPGWAQDLHKCLDEPPENIIEFTYEQTLQKSWWDKTVNFFTKLVRIPLITKLSIYGDDIIVYFTDELVRREAQAQLMRAILEINEPFILVGFSLGSILSYETLKWLQVDGEKDAFVYMRQFFTLGSPLSKAPVLACLRLPDHTILPVLWHNIYGNLDPLLSGRIEGLGVNEQAGYAVWHDFCAYLGVMRILKGVPL